MLDSPSSVEPASQDLAFIPDDFLFMDQPAEPLCDACYRVEVGYVFCGLMLL